MDDQLLVRRAAGGDLDSFGQLYDRHFNRVYDFVWRTLRDTEGVAAVTERVFVEARRSLRTLPKGASFGPWLFGIAHRETIGRAETAGVGAAGASHEEAFGSFGEPDAYRVAGGGPAGDGELPALVWEAVTQLNPRDYALLDLSVRQGLTTAEIATVLGVSRGSADTMVTRMKQAADGVIADYILARRGGEGCPELSRVVADAGFPPYTDEVRRAVDAHARECETCSRERQALGSPLALFASFAAVQAPFALKADIWRGLAGSMAPRVAPTGTATAVPRPLPPNPYAASPPPAGAYGGGGFAGPPVAIAGSEDPLRNRILLFAGAAVGLLVFAFAGAMIASSFGGGDDDGNRSNAAATRTANAGAGGPAGTPGVNLETSTPEDAETPDDDETETPTPTGEATETPTEAPADTPVPADTATPVPQPTDPPPTDVPNPPTATNTPSGIPFQ